MIQKTLTVSFVGPPNAGKSTLTNLIIGEKISGMSPKAHTTRYQVKGIKTIVDTQLIFLDNPGFTRNNTEVDLEAGCVCLTIDATHPWQYNMKDKIKQLLEEDVFMTIIVNKGDLIPKEKWIELIDAFQELGYKDIVWFTSAIYNKGIDRFIEFLCKQAPEAAWWFESNQKHMLTKEEIIMECVREKVFHLTHKEVPYGVKIEVAEMLFEKNKPWQAKVNIRAERKSQKSILIGKKANVVKSIGEAARLELCSRFGRGSLFLNIL